MTRMKRTLTAAALALCLTVGLAVPALALGQVEPETPGVLTLDVAEKEYRDDMLEHDAKVTVNVYQVAKMDENGLLTLTEQFQATALAEGWTPVWDANTNVAELTEDITAIVAPEVEEGETAPAPIEPLMDPVTLELPGGKIAGLTAGLYLLMPEKVETGEWAYTFGPMLLSVPALGTAEDAVDGRDPADPEASPDPSAAPAGEVDWQYDYTVFMKPERTFRTTQIIIDKTLRTYNASLGPTSFVFRVTGTKTNAEGADEVVYSNVVSVTFEKGGTQSVTVEGIPVGAKVTVEEIYSGASYTPVDGRVSVTIDELQLPEGENVTRVPFTNDYTWKPGPDQSVENKFVFTGGGWKWQESEVPTE